MSITIEEVTNKCLKSIDEQAKNLKTINIIIAGKTGVGKSTLINSVFREQFAKTGYGRPVTKTIRRLDKDGVPLVIYDTPGFELSKSQQDEVKAGISEIILKGLESNDVSKMIHCMWYCINVNTTKIDPAEIQWLKYISNNEATRVPVIIVLTQAYSQKDAKIMKECLEKEGLNVMGIIPVVAVEKVFDTPVGEYTIKEYGLESLIEVMAEELPSGIQNTLMNVQIVSLDLKRKQAEKAIGIAIAGGTAAAFTPIPLADLGIYMTSLFTMLGTITTIYGIKISNSVISSFLAHSLAGTGVYFGGQELLKLIPGIGQAVSGTISSVLMTAFTVVLGKTYIRVIEGIYKGEINSEYLLSDKGRRTIKKWMKEEMDIYKHRH